MARLPRPAKVIVTFGAPLRFERRDEKGRKTDYEAVSRAMMAAIGRLADARSTVGSFKFRREERA
jgi:hypothetical protein